MNAPLPAQLKLEQLSVAERLELLEAVWESLEGQSDDAVPSPEWHKAEIERRMKALDDGSSVGATWDEVRSRITRRP